MLPFLKKAKEAGVSAPIESVTRTPDEGAEYDPMESAAQDLLDAIKSNNIKDVAAALRAAIELASAQEEQE